MAIGSKHRKYVLEKVFSKLFPILQIARKEILTASELCALMKPGMILKLIFVNTYHLQPFFSSYGKRFLNKV